MGGFYRMTRFSLSLLSVLFLSLAACSGLPKGEAKYPTGADRSATGNNIYEKPASIFGEGGLNLTGRRESNEETGIGVNAYLWRASLDTIAFMPLDRADPYGGVITTDWYTAADTPNDRIKLTVLILTRTLSADGVSVKVIREVRGKNGWVAAKTAPETATRLEDAILTRARELRIADSGAEQ